ncbi:unnamed protein product [Adineta steineri]|uniref:Uncharacterized protein n=1 Tax=Adineta steineri TaxID=433720 RepID=A0A819D7F8_9BILA|nr:unnamed protein product [Adineta steineri]CAF0874779.1 unnamed protein product [Adineta steineri]CAF0938392.1 unnamed protein product [Adineta steineri]CAF3611285.1 unnamed protein product [Adineta steineri]CAF3744135.1 unnamed protein product [Adineta steineri]
MSDGINTTNNKHVDDYEDFRFQDAAQAIFSKYRMMNIIKSNGEINTTTSTAPIILGSQKTTTRSRACVIL